MRAPRIGSVRIRFVVIRIQNIYETRLEVNQWHGGKHGEAADSRPHGLSRPSRRRLLRRRSAPALAIFAEYDEPAVSVAPAVVG